VLIDDEVGEFHLVLLLRMDANARERDAHGEQAFQEHWVPPSNCTLPENQP
jgi:hypothetical protein